MRLKRRWWRKNRQLSCAEVGRVLQSFLDGELDHADRPSIEAHLDACRRCGLEGATYDRMKAALSQPTADDVDPVTIERLRAFGAELTGND